LFLNIIIVSKTILKSIPHGFVRIYTELNIRRYSSTQSVGE